MTEFQGTVLGTQMTRVEAQSRARDENTKYLTGLLQEIPGIIPAKMYEGCTRSSHHLYMMRYKSDEFAGLSRDKFIEALKAEGIPCLSGYSPIDFKTFVREAFTLNGRPRVYSKEVTDDWANRCRIPENDKLCKEAVWIMQENFIGPRGDMDQIADAIRKIRAHAGEIAKAS
jgi:dTDP-4-amino-4,6-dideoxygalactose transaminase